MAQVAPAFIGGHFFKAPPRLPGAVSKVVPEFMIGDVVDQLPWILGGPGLQSAEPVMYASLGQVLPTL